MIALGLNLKYIQRGYTKMKVVILHESIDKETVSSLRYFIERGKDRNKSIVFYDYIWYRSSNRVQIKTFRLFYWELDVFKQHFSIYNKL